MKFYLRCNDKTHVITSTMMKSKQVVLVTGGAGFIGSQVIDELLAKQYKIVILDNLSTGFKENIHKEAVFIEGDVTKPEDIEKVLKKHKIDIIFHIAGQPSIVNSFTDPRHDFDVNFIGTFNMIQASLIHKIQRFVYASSMTVYGNPEKLPVEETDPCVPINYYGVAKYAAERFLHITALKENDFKVTSFRMFNVYGPRQSLTNPYQGVLAIFMGNVLRNEPITIYGDGKQGRDFIYVEDVAKTWVNTIDIKESFGKVINIGYGKQTPILMLAKSVIKAVGENPDTYPILFKEQRPGDQRFIEADISLAEKLLSFKPTTSLDEGLVKTLSWAKLH